LAKFLDLMGIDKLNIVAISLMGILNKINHIKIKEPSTVDYDYKYISYLNTFNVITKDRYLPYVKKKFNKIKSI
jgi:hypothetical protein